MLEYCLKLDLNSVESYRVFLAAKSMPRYRVVGRCVWLPIEYAVRLGVVLEPQACGTPLRLPDFLFDYQSAIASQAIEKRKFAVFADCGFGKCLIMLCWSLHALQATGGRVLIVAPLMVIPQTVSEARRFLGEGSVPEVVPAAKLQHWLAGCGPALGITNYEAIREGLSAGNLSALALDESSMLKSHYGKFGQRLITLGKGLDWKLCLTGTPAPNDRIEYANHAVFLDRFPTVNSFLAKYFVNRGKTDSRWELKPHALRPFYRSLSDWCIFLTNPATYGWTDNVGVIPPIHTHIHEVPLTASQIDAARAVAGDMWGSPGGITSRSKLAQIARGVAGDLPSHKPAFIRNLVNSWPSEQTIIWCEFNREQDLLEAQFPDAASIRGDTPDDDRQVLIESFKSGTKQVLISKPKVLGFGLNLQCATRHVFSGLRDSYESYYQAVKRSNRVGSTRPLNVHLPVTEIEKAMIATVMRKANRVAQDTAEQEALFKECMK